MLLELGLLKNMKDNGHEMGGDKFWIARGCWHGLLLRLFAPETSF